MEKQVNELFSGTGDMPLAKDIKAFFDDLREYDNQHSRGTWLGRGMALAMMDHINHDEDIEKLERKVQENLTENQIYDRHQGTLKKLGLSIESPNKEGDFDDNEIYAVGEIVVNLVDKNLYVAYLERLNQETMLEEERELLRLVMAKLLRQIKGEYLLDELDDRLIEIFSGLKELVAEYERLGLAENVSELKDYQGYLNSGYLREYIEAKNHGIFGPVGEGFALSTYQRDSSSDQYLRYWNNNFFDILTKIENNPKAKVFYNEVIEYGRKCLAFAKEDLKKTREAKGDPEYASGLDGAMKEVEERISKLK